MSAYPALSQHDRDLGAERFVRDLIVAEYALSCMEKRKTFHRVPVSIDTLQALLRLLDRERFIHAKETP